MTKAAPVGKDVNDRWRSVADQSALRCGMLRCAILLVIANLLGCQARPATPEVASTPHEHHGHSAHNERHAAHQPGHHHAFTNAEEWSKRFDAPDRAAWQKPDEVVALMKLQPGAIVADIGAGTGYFLPYLSRAVGATGRVIATDIEPDMVRFMNERATKEQLQNVSARQSPPDTAGLEPESVDRALIVDVWHHIDDRVGFAKSLRAALRSGGQVFVVDFTLDSPHGPPPKYRMAPEAIAAELKAAGFVTEVVTESLPNQYIVRAW